MRMFSWGTCLGYRVQIALVSFRFVTAGGAASAIGGFLEMDFHGPLRTLEGHAGGDVIGQVAAVDGMAGLAGSALLGAMHMDIVQIFIAVSEAGEVGRFRFEHQVLVVTTEAECIVLQVELGVERFGECFDQQACVGGAVDVVTGGAITGAHGAVEEFAFERRAHVGNDVSVVGLQRFVVAGEA